MAKYVHHANIFSILSSAVPTYFPTLAHTTMKQCCFSSNFSGPGDVVLYEGPANAQILRFKRIAVGTLVCFSVIYPACAIGLNIGTATVGLGTRLLLTATGVFYYYFW